VRRAAHGRAAVREVPARAGRDAEQLAGGGPSCAGGRGQDVRDLQDPAVRAAGRLRLSPRGRRGRPGLRGMEQGDRGRRRSLGRGRDEHRG
jgi:hypothetical protein